MEDVGEDGSLTGGIAATTLTTAAVTVADGRRLQGSRVGESDAFEPSPGGGPAELERAMF